MNKKQKEKLVNALRALKNSLNAEAADLAAAITAFITEAEQSEDEITLETLTAKINSIVSEATKPMEETLENSVKVKVAAGMAEIKNAFKPVETKNYLKSKQATKDFCNCLRQAPRGDKKAFENAWKAKLIENGIEGLEFPMEIEKGIQTKWDEAGTLYSAIRKVSNRNFKVIYTDQDANDISVRARGHKKGNVKIPQELKLKNKEIYMQGIYKDMYLDRIDIIEYDDAALVSFIVDELADRLAFEIEKCILVGDGRPAGDDSKINKIEPILRDTADQWVNVVEPKGDIQRDFKDMVDSIRAKGKDIWLFVSPDTLTDLQTFKGAEGATTQFMPVDLLAQTFGVSRIVKTDMLEDKCQGIAMVPEMYYRIGGEMFGEQWTMFATNQEAFRSEVFMGGAVAGLSSAAVLKNPTI